MHIHRKQVTGNVVVHGPSNKKRNIITNQNKGLGKNITRTIPNKVAAMTVPTTATGAERHMTTQPTNENASSASGHWRRLTDDGLPPDWGGGAVGIVADFWTPPAAAIWWVHVWLWVEHENKRMEQYAQSSL